MANKVVNALGEGMGAAKGGASANGHTGPRVSRSGKPYNEISLSKMLSENFGQKL